MTAGLGNSGGCPTTPNRNYGIWKMWCPCQRFVRRGKCRRFPQPNWNLLDFFIVRLGPESYTTTMFILAYYISKIVSVLLTVRQGTWWHGHGLPRALRDYKGSRTGDCCPTVRNGTRTRDRWSERIVSVVAGSRPPYSRSNTSCGPHLPSTVSVSSISKPANVRRSTADDTDNKLSRYRCRSSGSRPSTVSAGSSVRTGSRSEIPRPYGPETANTDLTNTSISSRSASDGDNRPAEHALHANATYSRTEFMRQEWRAEKKIILLYFLGDKLDLI